MGVLPICSVTTSIVTGGIFGFVAVDMALGYFVVDGDKN